MSEAPAKRRRTFFVPGLVTIAVLTAIGHFEPKLAWAVSGVVAALGFAYLVLVGRKG